MVKMTDIATHLGVSRLTVSAVLNNRTDEVGISERTAEKVRKAAIELGYHRNHLAVAMKTGVNQVVGCLLSGLESEWTGRTLSGFLRNMHEANYLIKIEEVQGKQQESIALSRFMEQRVAGMFCCNFNPHADFVQELKSMSSIYRIPIIHAFSSNKLPGLEVNSDDRQGIRLAVDHLWEYGHRNIAFLQASNYPSERKDAFIEYMQERLGRAKSIHVMGHPDSLEEQDHLAESLFKNRNAKSVTAIVCATDMSAATTIRMARRYGLSAPGDISIVGFANSRYCQFTDPLLTTVEQPFELVGQKCGQRLIQLCNKKIASFKGNYPPADLIPTRLIIRESTGPNPFKKKR